MLVGIGGAAWVFLFGGLGGIAGGSSSPTPSPVATVAPSTAPTSVETTAEPTASASVFTSPTPTPLPTTAPDDAFAFYEVGVLPESYTLYVVEDGGVADDLGAEFSDFSHARVEPVQLEDGRVAWVTQNGFYAGRGYIWPDSGSFEIRAVFTAADGSFHATVLETDELTVVPEGTPAP
jgi:hypothetical protein